jgi:hypothetical protein
MAFVNTSPKQGHIDNIHKSSNTNVGPQSYDPEALAHKQLMEALYPKKKAPFNQTEVRESPLYNSKPMRNNPGKKTQTILLNLKVNLLFDLPFSLS